jgi:hypothetical protein
MPRLSPAEMVARKEKREREGKVNMARYLEQQQHTLDKTVRLRGLRLSKAPAKPSKRPSLQQERACSEISQLKIEASRQNGFPPQ